jgi:hypothetical protein
VETLPKGTWSPVQGPAVLWALPQEVPAVQLLDTRVKVPQQVR